MDQDRCDHDAPDCQVWGHDRPSPKFAVTCDGWCVPGGGACQTGITTCCAAGDTCTIYLPLGVAVKVRARVVKATGATAANVTALW